MTPIGLHRTSGRYPGRPSQRFRYSNNAETRSVSDYLNNLVRVGPFRHSRRMTRQTSGDPYGIAVRIDAENSPSRISPEVSDISATLDESLFDYFELFG